jgi:prophage DNA circulation protein
LAASRSSGDWILVLDADETMSDLLKAEIRQLIEPSSAKRNWLQHNRTLRRVEGVVAAVVADDTSEQAPATAAASAGSTRQALAAELDAAGLDVRRSVGIAGESCAIRGARQTPPERGAGQGYAVHFVGAA